MPKSGQQRGAHTRNTAITAVPSTGVWRPPQLATGEVIQACPGARCLIVATGSIKVEGTAVNRDVSAVQLKHHWIVSMAGWNGKHSPKHVIERSADLGY